MGWLDTLKKNLAGWNIARQTGELGHKGSWFGLPDIGVTELLKGQFSSYVDRHNPFNPPETRAEEKTLIYGPPYIEPQSPQRPIDTKGTQGTGTEGTTDTSTKEAENAYYSALNSILNRLALMRDIAQREIERARNVRDEVTKNIADTYASLLQKAEQAKQSSLESLGREDINVQNLYGRAAGTARRAMESAMLRNRMLARALNRLGSSFYEDRQAEALESGRKSIADIAAEEATKRSEIGTRTTETKNWFDQKATELRQEEAQLKAQAEAEYQAQVNAASDMERAYGIDSLAAAEQAERDYQSKLDQIRNYVQNKALRLAEIAAAAGNQKGIISAFQAITPELRGVLANQQALQAGQTLQSALANQWSPLGGSAGTDLTGFATFREDPQAEFYRKMRALGLLRV